MRKISRAGAVVPEGHGMRSQRFTADDETDGDRENDGLASTMLICGSDDAPFGLTLLSG